MPGYKSHLTGGLLIFFFFLALVLHSCTPRLLTMIEWALCTLAGSLFPDIDIKSKGQRLFYTLLLIIFLILISVQRYKALAFVSILAFVPLLVHHRGLCHQVWFVLFVPLSIALLLTTLMPTCRTILLSDAAFFSLGALSHLWLDRGIKRMFRW